MRIILMIGLFAAFMTSFATTASATEPPSGETIARGLGMTPAQLELVAGTSLDTIEKGVARLGTSRAGADLSVGGNQLKLPELGPHDRSAGSSCTGFGQRSAPGAGNNTWNVYGRHRVDCPPIVVSSWCQVMVYFPNNPNYPTSSNQATGNDDCDVSTWGTGYGWNLNGNMKGYWSATATAFWVNTHPQSCFTSQSFILCAFNTDFKIPGYPEQYNTFNWAPSGG